MATTKRSAGGHGRSVKLFVQAAFLASTFSIGTAAAQGVPPPVPVTQFDMTGFLQAATLSGSDVFAGGTLTVNGQLVVVPRNTIVVLPAAYLTWQQLFSMAPPPYGPTQTGLAMADVPAPFVPYEIHVVGNRVAVAGSDQYIAGLVYLSQQSLNSGAGYINWIDYTTGEFRVGGLIGDPTTGQRVRINDPLGKFGRAASPDARFTIDEDNPTVRTGTGFPMCMPRTDPAASDDALCPQANRPFDPISGTHSTQFTMPAPANVVPGGPDPMLTAPFEIGDFVTYSGTIVKDGGQPSVGPNPTIAGSYVSAWTVVANLGIFTAPGSDPVFVATEVTILGTGGVTAAGAAEATIRTRFEGFTTDPFRLAGTDPTCSNPVFKNTIGQPCSAIDLFGLDIDPCSGAISERNWGAIDVDQGPPFGAVAGRWRFRPPSKVMALPAGGVFDPPTAMVRARARGANVVVTKNGIVAGQYDAPITEYLFPENAAVGSPIVPNNFEVFRYLAQGWGPYGGSGGPVVGQLSPWPGSPAPAAASCAPAALTPPTANAGAAQVVASGALVTLDGSASTDPNGLPLTFAWTQVSGPAVSLNSASAAQPTFTAPTIPFGQPAADIVLQLVVSDTGAGASAPATVTVTVNAAPQTFTAPVANAGAALTVASGANVVLNGTASADTNTPALPLTFAWAQIDPLAPAVTLNGAATATPSFRAPIVPPGAPLVLTFNLSVTNSQGLGATATVTVTVNPALPPVANAGANQTVQSGATVTLDGTASFDPQALPLTYAWTQVAGPAVTLAGGNTATPSFTAPSAIAAPVTLGFTLVVNDGLASSNAALVTVTVNPGVDQVTITLVEYRISKQRLTVTATSNAPAAQLFLKNPSGGADVPLTLQAGVPTAILVGVAQPASVTVYSSLGGTQTSPVTKLRN